ncbi:MAG: hypothetical protein PWP58_1073 [Bacillota bacterium]|nr:hypothetical protein [Bacillota bacterium]
MWFRDQKHEMSYKNLVAKHCANEQSSGYLSALYILAALNKNGLLETVDVPECGLNFDLLLDAALSWSAGERALLRIAATLYNPYMWPTAIDDVFRHLNQTDFETALQALRLKYGRESGMGFETSSRTA